MSYFGRGCISFISISLFPIYPIELLSPEYTNRKNKS